MSPVCIQPDLNSETQVSVRTADHDEAKILVVKMKADLEEKYMEYQRSLTGPWEHHQLSILLYLHSQKRGSHRICLEDSRIYLEDSHSPALH